ncbi:putative cell wall associated protein/ RHS repeat family [Clostridium sp. CAG:678]|nr:putative cell wall associated protein/ RHS repeat family [Clostridium sp. CAG:678]
MIKNGKKFISALLAVVLITTVFPISTYAAETEDSDDIQVSEVEESRDLYSKTYETSQGTNVVISTAVPMHYEEDGELKDIDNTLVESDADNSVLTNTANAYNVELPEKYTDDSEIKLNYEDNTISFKLLNDVNSSNGTVISNDETDVDKTDAESVAYAESNINSLTSGITYADVLPDTDVEYNVQPNSLKENIILSDVPDEDYAIQYELDTADMSAVLNDDNSISVVDDNSNKVFIIAAPYMVDANDNVSESINVSFEESENGYILTYSPDYTWLTDEDTTYPVNIDPTVTIVSNKANQNIEDTFVTTTTKTKNKSTMTTVAVQNSSSQSWGYYNIKTLPELPDNAKITNCTLNLFTTTDVYDPYSLAMYALPEDAQVNDDYISKVNWNNKIEPTDVAIDLQITPENPNQIYFDITNLANKWYQNNDLNRILVLKALDGTLKTTIASSEYTIYANRTPYLSLEYNTVGGLDSNSQFHIQNAGIAGTAYVNDYTGNLVIERTDFSSNGSMGDLTFYMGKGVNTPEGSWLGDNVSVNYYKTLMVDSVNDDSEYVLTYGDGTKEYISDGEKYTIDHSEETLINISYTQDSSVVNESYSSAVISENSEKNIEDRIFALVEKSTTKNAKANPDANSSTVTVTYADDKITQIADEVGYTEFGYADGIINSLASFPDFDDESVNKQDCEGVGQLTSYYTDNGVSLSIDLNEDDTGYPIQNITYDYANSGNITKITNQTDLSYEYTYNDNDQVIKVQEYSTDSTAGEYLTFSYGANTTTISDGTNTYTEYFDLSGKLMSVIDQDGNAVFAQYNGDLISKVSATRNSARNIADFYGFESNKDSFFNTENGYVGISSDAKFNGNSSVKLTTPAQVNAVYTNKINGLEKNSTYTVSMWLNQPASANASLTLTNGDSSGIFTTANAQNAEGWQQVYCTIDTEDSTYINVSVSVDNSTSSAETAIYIDNMYVQQSPYLTNVNLLSNSDFADLLNGWSTNANSSVVSEDAVISTADNNRLKITGDFSAENSISQTVSITASEGTKYTYGGWIKAVNAIPEKDGTNRKLGFSVYAVSADGSSQELLSENTYSTYYSDWQYLEDEITLPADFGHAGDTYSALKFVINYDYQMGYALFDGVSLAKDELFTSEFEYDEDGNMIAITTGETTVSVKDSNEDTDHSLAETTYTYDDYGNITGITETATVDDVARDIVSKFEYGNSGSLLTKELTPLGRWTTYEYDYFANVARVTDANGNTVDYEYDNFNNLSGIISEFENKYIQFNDRESQSPEVYTMKVQYTYSGDRLDKIETGNIEDDEFVPFNTYAFEYDNWGNLENIYINDMDDPYVHYIYDGTDYRRINSIEYINGQEINYVYDDEGNIIYKYDTNNADGDTLSYSYYYYDNGTCYGKKNNIAGTIESYQDGLTSVKDMDGNVIHVYGYDEDGNLLEQIGNNFVKISKTSDDSTSQLSSTVNNSETVISTEYDDFGRVISEKIQAEGTSSYILREYTYYENEEEMDEAISSISNIITGNELEEIDTDVDSTDLVRYLTYYSVDENGNKEVIEEYRYLYYANGKTLSYTVSPVSGGDIFDVESIVLNACNEAGMAMGGTGTLFEYDKYGNIIKVYENSDELTPYIDLSYDSESNTALKNLLTGFTLRNINNEDFDFNISYDEFGNISKVETEDLTSEMANGVGTIRFSGVDLNWSRGSTLTNITGNIDISLTDLPLVSYPISVDLFDYKYDDNNLRTNKTINLSLDSIPTSILSALGISEEEATLAKADIDYIWRDGLLAGINVDCNGTLFDEGNVTHGNGGGKYSIVILYDENNNAYGLVVNKTEDADGNAVNETNTFYYMKDADNVITAIIDENGKELVSYGYDNNGAVMSLNNADGYRYLMLLNPLAYKDSVYDIESGLYYLESRYYEPYLGRFISPNSVLDTGSDSVMCTNLYSYCENDPVNNVDPSTGTNTVNSNIITNNAADIVLPFKQVDSDLSKFWNTENMLPQQKYGTYLW